MGIGVFFISLLSQMALLFKISTLIFRSTESTVGSWNGAENSQLARTFKVGIVKIEFAK